MGHLPFLRSGAALVVLCLTACAPLGKHSPLESPTAYSLPAGQSVATETAWWQRLNDPKLNRLIGQALAQAPEMRILQARLTQAQAQLGRSEAAAKPDIRLTAEGIGIYAAPAPTSTHIQTDRTLLLAHAALESSWSFDFWGRNRANIRAALGQRQALLFEGEHTRLLLAQAVAAQYFSWQSLVGQERLLQQRLAYMKEAETLTRQRIRAQILPASAVYPLEQAQLLLQAEQQKLAGRSARVRHSLAVLSGRPANALDGDEPSAPAALPVMAVGNVRADVLGRRPDIAAQQSLLTARAAQVDAAKAAFYPNIELKLLAGLAHIDAFDVVGSKRSGILGVLPAVSLPLFDAASVRTGLTMRRAEYSRQVALYDQTVLNAMREAADALSDYQTLSAQLRLLQQAAARSEKAAAATRKRVGAGLTHQSVYLQRLDELLTLQAQTLSVQADALAAWGNVHTRLGGGFDGR